MPQNLVAKIVDYLKLARFHQPTGIWLLFLPVLFTIIFIYKVLINRPDFIFPLLNLGKIILIFFVGAVLTRSAGCIINDIFDAKFDAKVARTKSRPIAAGKISKIEAVIFAAILLLAALFILLHFNKITIILGLSAGFLMMIYPLTKRITYLPQLFLGITFNFGVLLVCSAMLGKINIEAVLIYFAAIIWTLIYDTIYAFQDLEDDLKIGVKSATMLCRKNPQLIFLSLLVLVFLLLALAGYLAGFDADYFFFLGLAHFLLGRKIINCNFSDPKSCLAVFKFNVWFGLIIIFALILQ